MVQDTRLGIIDRASEWCSRRLATRCGYALVFGALFVLAWIPVLAVLASCDKSFFWKVDGLSQQYVWFVYTGQWLRDVLTTVFVEHSLDIPVWTMDSGFGLDAFQAVLCTVINPVYAVSVFVPEEYAEYAFEFMMLVCIYCSGLAFSAWCLARGCARSHTLAGALVYVFAGNLVTVFTQPGFLFPVLAFPLVLWAADRVFARKSPLPFVAIMAWVLMFSFYDAYMICIMLVGYCLVTFFCRIDRDCGRAGRMRRLAGWVGRFVLYMVLAILVSCVFFLPQAMSLGGSGRLALDRVESLFYSASFYLNFVLGFTSYDFTGGDAYTGLSALAPLAVIVLFLRRKRYPGLLLCFVVLTVMLCIPFFGRVMNAMQYPTDRWAWAYSLLAAYAVARLLPDMLDLGRRERRVVIALVGVYVVVCMVLPIPGRAKIEAGVLAVACVACLFARSWGARRAVAVVVLAAAVSGSASFAWFVAPSLGGKAKELVDAGTMWELHSDRGAADLVQTASQDGNYDHTYRYDRGNSACWVHNSNLVTGNMAPDFYNSIYNDGVDELLVSLGVTSTEGANNRFGSLSSRTVLDALLGVRYYYANDREVAMLPYTFRDASVIAEGTGRKGIHTALYETDQVLPLAFTMDRYITSEQYYALPVEARQEALLQALVLDDDAAAQDLGVQNADTVDTSVVDVPFTVASSNGCEVDGTTITALGNEATVTLSFDSPADAETYLVLRGMDYRALELSDSFTDEALDTMDTAARLKLQASDIVRTRSTNGYLGVSTQGHARSTSAFYPNAQDPIYGGKRDWVCNLGYSDEATTELTITFHYSGVYTFEGLSVAALPMEGFDRRIAELQEGAAADIAIGANEVSCTATADGDELLFFSVAYSDGWSATVDGEPAQIVRADLGFMAVPISAGTHEVVLTYRTPWLAEGAALTAVGVVATAAVLFARRRRARSLAVRDAVSAAALEDLKHE